MRRANPDRNGAGRDGGSRVYKGNLVFRDSDGWRVDGVEGMTFSTYALACSHIDREGLARAPEVRLKWREGWRRRGHGVENIDSNKRREPNLPEAVGRMDSHAPPRAAT